MKYLTAMYLIGIVGFAVQQPAALGHLLATTIVVGGLFLAFKKTEEKYA